MAFNTNLGSWIHNLERRDMMLLASLAGNLFGFTGTCAKEKQASLAPIQMGWKRWGEIHSNKGKNEPMTPRTEWTQNLQISGSIETNTDAKVVSWNIGPDGYKGSKEVVHQIFEQGPLIICLQYTRIPKRWKQHVKRELQRLFPPYWIYITTAQSPRKDSRDRPYVFSVLTALRSAFLPKVMQVRCRHSRQMSPEIRRELDGQLSILQGRKPTGDTFKFMNIYQFTASNPTGQTEMRNTTENWIIKQEKDRIIMQGDLNSAHPEC